MKRIEIIRQRTKTRQAVSFITHMGADIRYIWVPKKAIKSINLTRQYIIVEDWYKREEFVLSGG